VGNSGTRLVPANLPEYLPYKEGKTGWPSRTGIRHAFAIEVSDLAATVDALRQAGAHFRNDIVTGVGGKQILVDDLSGNPIELFEPIMREARLGSTSS
jgi:hypothetical protein